RTLRDGPLPASPTILVLHSRSDTFADAMDGLRDHCTGISCQADMARMAQLGSGPCKRERAGRRFVSRIPGDLGALSRVVLFVLPIEAAGIHPPCDPALHNFDRGLSASKKETSNAHWPGIWACAADCLTYRRRSAGSAPCARSEIGSANRCTRVCQRDWRSSILLHLFPGQAARPSNAPVDDDLSRRIRSVLPVALHGTDSG